MKAEPATGLYCKPLPAFSVVRKRCERVCKKSAVTLEHEEMAMKNRAQIVRLGYTIVNLYVLTAILLALLQTTRFRSTSIAHVALFMVLGTFAVIPVSAVVLWILNRPCRRNHTRPQQRYLIASRIILALAWLLSCVPPGFLAASAISQVRGTTKTMSTTPLIGGHEFIVKQTMTPGFLDPSISRRLSIRWASGRTEDLPTTFEAAEQYVANVLVAGGYVFIPAGRTLFYRPGTVTSAQGPWRMWEITSSQALNAFLRKYAKEHGDAGVTITSHADELHIEQSPSVVIVYPSIMVTNEDIRYKTGRYVSSALRNRGLYLPHLIESVDSATLKIVMKSNEAITSMPRYLVFSVTNTPNLTWVFSEAETKAQELQPSARPYGSPEAGSPSGQP